MTATVTVLDEIVRDYVENGMVNLDIYDRRRLRQAKVLRPGRKEKEYDRNLLFQLLANHSLNPTTLADQPNILYDAERIILKCIASTEEYLNLINKVGNVLTKEREVYYRGQDSAGLTPVPGVYRKTTWSENEHKLYREMILYSPSQFLYGDATFDKLAKMQHYNLPTRLLDITTNPLIALFFACVERPGAGRTAGEIFFFNVPQRRIKYSDSDTVTILANLAKLGLPMDLSANFAAIAKYCRHKIGSLKRCDDCNLRHSACQAITDLNDDSNRLIAGLLHEIKYEKPNFKHCIYPAHLNNYSVVVIPKQNNERLIRQSGAFFLFGIKQNKAVCADIKEFDFVYDGTKTLKTIIPLERKKAILAELERLNIHEGTLFPELDKVGTYLRSTRFRR